MKKIKYLILTISSLTIVLLSACEEHSSDSHSGSKHHAGDTLSRTVISYLVGDNSLNSVIRDNFLQLYENYSKVENRESVNLLAYLDIRTSSNLPTTPTLYKFEYNEKSKIVDTICVKRYEELNSVSIEQINEVLTTVMEEFPAEEYALLWGSHGSGWYPSDDALSAINGLSSRWLGPDDNIYIDLPDLHYAIPDEMNFEYILFDACFMSQGEIAYLFRDKAKYLIAAPTEVPSAGFPYYDIINLLCNAKELSEYKKICEIFAEKYETGWYSISLLDLDKIEALADAFHRVIDGVSDEELAALRVSNVQNFDGSGAVGKGIVCFDLKDIASKLLGMDYDSRFSFTLDFGDGSEMDPEVIWSDLCDAIDDVVLYEKHSDRIHTSLTDVQMTNVCGISTYWPQSKEGDAVNRYYLIYDWADKSGLAYYLNYVMQ